MRDQKPIWPVRVYTRKALKQLNDKSHLRSADEISKAMSERARAILRGEEVPSARIPINYY